jgi:hypothetical protein
MRLMEKHLILDFKELHLIGIECSVCKTTVIVDINEAKYKPPVACAACKQTFYGLTNGSTPFQLLVDGLKAALSSTYKLTAHIAGTPFEL